MSKPRRIGKWRSLGRWRRLSDKLTGRWSNLNDRLLDGERLVDRLMVTEHVSEHGGHVFHHSLLPAHLRVIASSFSSREGNSLIHRCTFVNELLCFLKTDKQTDLTNDESTKRSIVVFLLSDKNDKQILTSAATYSRFSFAWKSLPVSVYFVQSLNIPPPNSGTKAAIPGPLTAQPRSPTPHDGHEGGFTSTPSLL